MNFTYKLLFFATVVLVAIVSYASAQSTIRGVAKDSEAEVRNLSSKSKAYSGSGGRSGYGSKAAMR